MSWKRIDEGLNEEITERLKIPERLIVYPDPYLNDACGGVAPTDNPLIGANSGFGKTQYSIALARSGLEKGKTVHMFSLEADKHEITRRLKFPIFADLYNQEFSSWPLYQDWVLGKLMERTTALEAETNEVFKRRFNLDFFTYQKINEFTVNNLIEEFVAIVGSTDMVILDHTHVVDHLETERYSSENRELKKIAQTIRDLTIQYEVPIVMISHIRKGAKEYKTPTLEDFHGSSDIYKISTQAILFGSGDAIPRQHGRYYTYCTVVKNRRFGGVTRYTSELIYNEKVGGYENTYQVGKNNQKREAEFEPLVGVDIPSFARGASGRDRVLPADNRKPRISTHTRGEKPLKGLPYKDD